MNTFQKKSHRILVVDDTPENIQVIGTVLRQKGFLISIAQSGREALAIVEQELPDLILLDIIMPGMDGFETCRRLKTTPATKDIPVIFMSALTDTTDKIRGFAAGAVDYVTKPVGGEELLARINAHLTIKFLYRELEEANERLQEKVRLRTRDLENELKQRKLAEEAMRKSEEKHRALLEIIKRRQTDCSRLSRLMAIDRIEDFADEMKALGIEHDCQPLILWAEELRSSAQLFNTVKIQGLLQVFQSAV